MPVDEVSELVDQLSADPEALREYLAGQAERDAARDRQQVEMERRFDAVLLVLAGAAGAVSEAALSARRS